MSVFLWLSIGLVVVALVILMRDDLQFIGRGKRRVRGTVYGHIRHIDADGDSFQAQVTFLDDTGCKIEFVDFVLRQTPTPDVGSEVNVVYPAGMPGKARLPRPFLRAFVYVSLMMLLLLLVARLFD